MILVKHVNKGVKMETCSGRTRVSSTGELGS